MDLSALPTADLTETARRLERQADLVEGLAARLRSGAGASWRGEAAARHHEVVTGHATDLVRLGRELRDAAAAVRRASTTATHHVEFVLAAGERVEGLVDGVVEDTVRIVRAARPRGLSW